MERNIFFIDRNGNKKANEDFPDEEEIIGHEDLAELIISEDEILQSEFNKSTINSKALFLTLQKGYLQGTDSERYKEIAFYSPMISDKQRQILAYYHEEGYYLTNLKEEHIMGDEEER